MSYNLNREICYDLDGIEYNYWWKLYRIHWTRKSLWYLVLLECLELSRGVFLAMDLQMTDRSIWLIIRISEIMTDTSPARRHDGLTFTHCMAEKHFLHYLPFVMGTADHRWLPPERTDNTELWCVLGFQMCHYSNTEINDNNHWYFTKLVLAAMHTFSIAEMTLSILKVQCVFVVLMVLWLVLPTRTGGLS